MKIIKDGVVIDATEKAYRVVYRDQGYRPYVSEKIKISDMTKAEIMEKLDEEDIDYDPNDLKQELFDLLGSD